MGKQRYSRTERIKNGRIARRIGNKKNYTRMLREKNREDYLLQKMGIREKTNPILRRGRGRKKRQQNTMRKESIKKYFSLT